MKLIVTKNSLRRVLRWAQRGLFAVAIALLGYCGFVLTDAWIFQLRANSALERRLQDERSRNGTSTQATVATLDSPPAIAPDGLIGRIEIRRIGLSAIVFEGVDKNTLRHAVGHIPDTALPGKPGNAGLAAHRDTFFRPLKDVRLGDAITLTTLRGEYRYRVVSTRVVPPTEVSVLDPSENQVLTLVTCYPFYFVGAAPERFIVRAERD